MVKTRSLHCQDLGSAHKPHGTAGKKKEKTFMRGSREFHGWGAWWATVHGVAKSRT